MHNAAKVLRPGFSNHSAYEQQLHTYTSTYQSLSLTQHIPTRSFIEGSSQIVFISMFLIHHKRTMAVCTYDISSSVCPVSGYVPFGICSLYVLSRWAFSSLIQSCQPWTARKNTSAFTYLILCAPFLWVFILSNIYGENHAASFLPIVLWSLVIPTQSMRVSNYIYTLLQSRINSSLQTCVAASNVLSIPAPVLVHNKSAIRFSSSYAFIHYMHGVLCAVLMGAALL